MIRLIKHDRLTAWDIVMGFAVFAAMLVHFGKEPIGAFEGARFPVVEEFDVLRIEPASMIDTRASGQMNIVRDACDFRGVEWVLSNGQREVWLDVVFEEGIKARPGGWQGWGPWRIGVQFEAFSRTRVYSLHQCPWRPWETRTLLWDGSQIE